MINKIPIATLLIFLARMTNAQTADLPRSRPNEERRTDKGSGEYLRTRH